ncbi:tyrosine-type recombinase/integrase [Phyllobacterium sp. SYP-B3895]|uniref:tyrosine-type recombinase/integrase n=1 Tax=Phyllobacterium sp. SYP-B3895 TaxID=2663240 RepID=UPI0012998254|nr:site-specific integrase [Phyllobacterium sp. SYP-B3895]MRG55285.1 tyrosine-type recombinase/integrase [Phyllobacterium sp. SYP-B3895]
MPRLKMTKEWADAIVVDTRTEFYDTIVRDLEMRVEPQPRNTKTWYVRYGLEGAKKRPRYKLGRYPDIPVSIAREKAKAIAGGAVEGKDVAGERRADRAALTVKQLGALYIEKHAKPHKKTWKGDETLLESEVYPVIGNHKINKVRRRDLLDIIEAKYAEGKKSQSRNIKALLSKLFNWALASDYIETAPSLGLKAIGKPAKRDRVLGDAEIKVVLEALPSAPLTQNMRDILLLLFYTGQRAGEVAGMRRSEINVAAAEWLIPASRTKNQRQHLVPLSKPVLAIVQAAMQRTKANALFSRVAEEPIESNAVAKAVRANLQVLDERWTAHDARRTFVTGLNEMKVAPHVVEASVNHVSGFRAGVAGIYNQAQYQPEIRKAMITWAAHLANVQAGKSNVVPLEKTVSKKEKLA